MHDCPQSCIIFIGFLFNFKNNLYFVCVSYSELYDMITK